VNAIIYLEGGGDSDTLRSRCREGFHKLLDRMGVQGRKPRLVACGGRGKAYDRFKTELREGRYGFVGLWIDSEEPIGLSIGTDDQDWYTFDVWDHLMKRDGWERPSGAKSTQVLLMVTCMETWIVADRETLKKYYGASKLSVNSLPALNNLESCDRHTVQKKLETATASCSNAYKKGKRSFEILGVLDPEALKSLASFRRANRILKEVLRS
jgi:hypothetical protein